MRHKVHLPNRSEATTPVRPRALRAAALAAILAVSAAHAEAPPRCAVLGQVAMSVWLDMVGALGAGETFEVTADLQRLDRATAVYARTGCDAVPLAAAMDCLLTGAESAAAAPRAAARNCLAEAGLIAAP